MASIIGTSLHSEVETQPPSSRAAASHPLAVRRAGVALGIAVLLAGLVYMVLRTADMWLWLLAYLAICTCLAGIAVLRGHIFAGAPRIEIDTICHEIRMVHCQGRSQVVLRRCSFRDLAQVDHTPTHMRLWDSDATLIAEVPVADVLVHRSLSTALRVAGKL